MEAQELRRIFGNIPKGALEMRASADGRAAREVATGEVHGYDVEFRRIFPSGSPDAIVYSLLVRRGEEIVYNKHSNNGRGTYLLLRDLVDPAFD